VLGAVDTVLSTCATVDWTGLGDPDPDPVEVLDALPLAPVDCDEPAPDVDEEECDGAALDVGVEGAGVDGPLGVDALEPEPGAVLEEPDWDAPAVVDDAPWVAAAVAGALVGRLTVPATCRPA
jgi:hypothetical protein